MLTNQQVVFIINVDKSTNEVFVMFDRFEKFALTIAQLNRYVQKIKNMEMTEMGLKGNHTMCLYYLGRNSEGLTSTELCTLCKEDKAAVSRTVTELERLEMIKPDDTDGKREYRTKLHLTEKGENTVRMIDAKVKGIVDMGGSGLTNEERETLYHALDVITENLQKIAKTRYE